MGQQKSFTFLSTLTQAKRPTDDLIKNSIVAAFFSSLACFICLFSFENYFSFRSVALALSILFLDMMATFSPYT